MFHFSIRNRKENDRAWAVQIRDNTVAAAHIFIKILRCRGRISVRIIRPLRLVYCKNYIRCCKITISSLICAALQRPFFYAQTFLLLETVAFEVGDNVVKPLAVVCVFQLRRRLSRDEFRAYRVKEGRSEPRVRRRHVDQVIRFLLILFHMVCTRRPCGRPTSFPYLFSASLHSKVCAVPVHLCRDPQTERNG